jgi:hypothetical protein
VSGLGSRALALAAGGGGGGAAAPFHQAWRGLTGVRDGSTIAFTGAGYTSLSARGAGDALTVNGPAGGGKVWRASVGQTTGAALVFEDVGAVDTAAAVLFAINGPQVNSSIAGGCSVDLGFIQSQVGDGQWDGGGLDRITFDLGTAKVSNGTGAGIATRGTNVNASYAFPRGNIGAVYCARVGTQMVTAIGSPDGGWAQIYLDTVVTANAGSWILRLEQNIVGGTMDVDIMAHMPHGVWAPSLTDFPMLALD